MGNKIAFAGPAYMELGWEICTWQSYLRKLSHDYDKMYISTFPGMEPLYAGFHCETVFLPHNHPGRAQDWRDPDMWMDLMSQATEGQLSEEIKKACIEGHIEPIKQYKTDGEYIRYGTSKDREIEILFHARGIKGCSFKNWQFEKWKQLASNFPKAASIGSQDDQYIPGTTDRRNIPLQNLMDLMAGAKVVVGQSSGVMHLASLCGTRHVVWGDKKTYFGQRLEKRYREDWNPLGTPVSWVETEAWNPEPDEVLAVILHGTAKARPTDRILNRLKLASESGRYMISLSYMGSRDDKETIESYCESVEFPNDNLLEAIEQMKADMAKIAAETGVKQQDGEVSNAWR